MRIIFLLLTLAGVASADNYAFYELDDGVLGKNIISSENILRIDVIKTITPAISESLIKKSFEKLPENQKKIYKEAYKNMVPTEEKVAYSYEIILSKNSSVSFCEYTKKNMFKRIALTSGGNILVSPNIMSVINKGVIACSGNFSEEELKKIFPKDHRKILYIDF